MKKLVVYLPGVKLGYRDLQNADFANQIESNYDVSWVFSQEIPSEFKIKSQVYSFSKSIIREYIWTLLFELSSFLYNKNILGGKQSFPFLGLSKKQKFFLKFIYALKSIFFFKKIFEIFLDLTYKKVEYLNDDVSAVICFTSSKDLIFDDLIRNAKSINTKVILVCINWDNATSKPFLKKPDYIFTWGAQTAELAEKLHGIKSLPIGCPRYEKYKDNLNVNLKLYNSLQELDNKYTCLLFAGVGFPFPEIATLNLLSDTLEKLNLNNFRIIYRIHPYAWERVEVQKNSNFEKYVILDPTLNLFEKDDLNQYQFIFKLCKGVITAYSTILVESLINNLPLLLIAFNDDENFDWQNAAKIAPHLNVLKESSYILKCNDFEKLECYFVDFLNKISQNNDESNLKLSSYIILQNDLSYFENFKLQLNNII